MIEYDKLAKGKTYYKYLVRMRSPVQIRIAAPRKPLSLKGSRVFPFIGFEQIVGISNKSSNKPFYEAFACPIAARISFAILGFSNSS